ncbi:hypothetical protein BJX70DRAFT_403395 [Aspergillus crustosus]
MQRDALFVDIALPTAIEQEKNQIIRMCNTHLESLASGVQKRPLQLKVSSEFMHGTRQDGGLPIPSAAILAGDLNAFAPQDAVAVGDCDLKDAFLVLGGVENTEEAYTWGKQNPAWLGGRFPDARMDKVLFCGRIEVLSYKTIGVGLKARVVLLNTDESGGEEEDDDEHFEDVWVTDHFGLAAEFTVNRARE